MNLFEMIIRKVCKVALVVSLGSAFLATLPSFAPGFSTDVVGTALAKSDKGNSGNNGNGNGGNSGNAGGNGNGNGGGKGAGGSSSSPSGSASGATADPGVKTEEGTAARSRTLRIVHRNGISETIRAGRYEMRDARGRVIVNRAATQRDTARLSRSTGGTP